jgi:hypothetical protein
MAQGTIIPTTEKARKKLYPNQSFKQTALISNYMTSTYIKTVRYINRCPLRLFLLPRLTMVWRSTLDRIVEKVGSRADMLIRQFVNFHGKSQRGKKRHL